MSGTVAHVGLVGVLICIKNSPNCCQLYTEKAGKLHLLRIEVADFLRNIDNSCKRGVVAFLLPLLIRAAGSADFNRQLFAASLPDQLAPRLLLRVLGGAR